MDELKAMIENALQGVDQTKVKGITVWVDQSVQAEGQPQEGAQAPQAPAMKPVARTI